MNRNSLTAQQEKKLYEAKLEFEFFAEKLSEYIQDTLNGKVQGGNLQYCTQNVKNALDEIASFVLVERKLKKRD